MIGYIVSYMNWVDRIYQRIVQWTCPTKLITLKAINYNGVRIWYIHGWDLDKGNGEFVKYYLNDYHLSKALYTDEKSGSDSLESQIDFFSHHPSWLFGLIEEYLQKAPARKIFSIDTEWYYLWEDCKLFQKSIELQDNIPLDSIPFLLKIKPCPKELRILYGNMELKTVDLGKTS